ncbi:MAG: hypothetical protein ACLPVF_04950 [Acidimicrobiales bacterium]
MPAVRWICISDLHLGALNSILTSVSSDGERVDQSTTSPVTVALCEGLRALSPPGHPPQLVVAGDLFELALSSSDDAAATFAQFIACLRPGATDAAVGPHIRFIPGNHDHQLWTRARSDHYLEYLARLPRGEALHAESHVTHLLPANDRRPVRDRFIELLAARTDTASPVVVEQSYPNLGLVGPTGARAVVVSHGHFVEPLYRMMSLLDDVFTSDSGGTMSQHLEADNGGWIDFFWSSMGDSGDIGTWTRDLYESLQSEKSIDAVTGGIRRAMARRPGSRIRNHIEGAVVADVLKRSVKRSLRRERHLPGVLSKNAAAGLLDYLDGPVAAQLREEVGSPPDVTFVFGHTHKPFSDVRIPPVSARPVNIFNTGGWVVDTPEPEPVKGAAVVLIDDDLNVATVRFYAQEVEHAGHAHRTGPPIRVEGAGGVFDNPLVEELRRHVDPDRDPWRALAEATAATVKDRRRQLEARLAAEEADLARTDRRWRRGGGPGKGET